jgi:hypothetical protein
VRDSQQPDLIANEAIVFHHGSLATDRQ